MWATKDKAANVDERKRYLSMVHTDDTSRREFGDASEQIAFDSCALEAIDRILNTRQGDALLCEATCLGYAVHAASMADGPKEVWIVPPLKSGIRPAEALIKDFETTVSRSHPDLMSTLEGLGGVYKGFTATVPEGPFKLLITTQFCGVPVSSALEWPDYNQFWIGMLNACHSTGAVIYPSANEQDEKNPSLLRDNIDTGDFATAVELSNGRVVLGLGVRDGGFLMEDLTNPDDPWIYEASQLSISVNDGCLVPSIFRSGVEVVNETTLGEIASRISRGTTLSEKDLDVSERLSSRVVEPPERNGSAKTGESRATLKPRRGYGYSSGIYTLQDKWTYALENDLYYIDGSCFNEGDIWPTVLNSIPKGQERYIVDERDGDVILVSRNSKEPVVYRAIRPTLIGNSVFVIRIGADINRDYLACWMRGWYAKRHLRDGGKILSKGIIESLPVPILDSESMEQAIRYENVIDEKIFDLREEIGKLESCNRFAPLAAKHFDLHRSSRRAFYRGSVL